MKYAKKVGDNAKISALNSMMPETLFGESGVFRGRSFNLYADLRTAIINYLDACVNDFTNINSEHGADF